jgi:hypothetical protein
MGTPLLVPVPKKVMRMADTVAEWVYIIRSKGIEDMKLG